MMDVENILSCSICMEIFRVPRVLPCQHTFCEHCLSSYISDIAKKKGKKKKSAIAFKCPLCRTQVELKEEPFDASKFPLNLTMVAFVDTTPFLDTSSESSNKNIGQTRPDKDKANRLLVDGKSQNTRECSFDLLLDTSDELSRHITRCVLDPIVNYDRSNVKLVLAITELLTCVIIFSYILNVIKQHNLWLIYVISLVHIFRRILVSTWKLRQNMDLRIYFRTVVGHAVIHMFEFALFGCFVFFGFFIGSFLESIRTAPVRRLNVMSDQGQPQCVEEKYLDFKYVLNQALQIMYLTFGGYVTQFHTFKDNCYRLLINYINSVNSL